ncbi:MAG: sialidase family protein [Bacteroidota bacterium]
MPRSIALVICAILLFACSQFSNSDLLIFKEVQLPVGEGSAFPQMIEQDGKLYLSWTEEGEEISRLKMAVLDKEKWSEPIELASGKDWFVNWADFPEIFMDEHGDMYAHHLAKTAEDTYAYGVNVSRKKAAEDFFEALGTPYTDTSHTEHGFVSFFNLPDGDPGVVWLDGRKYKSDKKEMSLRTAKIAEDGSFYDEFEIDGRTCDCCQTDAAQTASGAIVVYRDRSEGEVRDIYRSIYKDGKWQKGAPVAEDAWVINGCPVNGPAVAAEGDRVAVAWFTMANDSPRVKLAISEDGGAFFGKTIRIDKGNAIGRVDLLWHEGEIYVSWMERDASNQGELLLRKVDRNANLTEPQLVREMSSARASGFPIMIKRENRLNLAYTEEGEIPRIRMWEATL